jgi:hypothetical protein
VITRDEWDKLSADEQWEMVDLLQLRDYVREQKEAEEHIRKQWNSAGIKLDGKR